MTRRTAATLGLVLALTGCSSEVVAGRNVPASTAVQTDARFTDIATIGYLDRDVRNGVEAINTYDYRSLEASRTNALRYTTGTLSNDLSNTFRTVLATSAPPLQASQRAQAIAVGIAAFSGTRASLLVFGRLTVRTKNLTQPRIDAFAVTVEAQRISGSWKLSKVTANGSLDRPAPGTTALQAAARAARTTAVALTSYRRASFDADFARTLSMLTAPLRTETEKTRAATLNAMTSGGFDLSGEARAVAVETASGAHAVVLVSLDGYRVTAGRRNTPTRQNLRVSVVRTNGRWLAEQVVAVGAR